MKPPTVKPGRRDVCFLGGAVLTFVVSLVLALGLGLSSATRPVFPQDATSVEFEVDLPYNETSTVLPPKVTSPSAIVIEEESGRVLYERNAHQRRPMASTTKIMTASLVLENLPLQASVLVSEQAAKTGEPSPWLRAGDVLTVEQLLYALMLRSSNAAAVALAEACSGDVKSFVEQMNRKAAELGLNDTHFVNPHGLDEQGHYSTAADLAALARYAMHNEMFRKLVSTKKYTLKLPGRQKPIVFENTNKLLQTVDWVDGIKTGLTPKAEQCLVGSGTRNGVRVISVVLGQPASAVCWDESRALLDFGLSQYRYVSILEAGQVVAQAQVPYRRGALVQLVAANSLSTSAHSTEKVVCSVSIETSLRVPVAAGTRFGRAAVLVDGRQTAAVDVVAAQSYGETTLGRKVAYLFECLGGAIARVF